jgi:DNA-binding CsgD family transcriptional regulator/PAS domain-containing protein
MSDFAPVARGIEQAALDAAHWPQVLADLSERAGAGGAVLLSTEKRFRGVPFSPGMEDLAELYFRDDWSDRDLRCRGLPLMLQRGVSVDQDYAAPEEFERSAYYQDLHGRVGYRWSACVGFRAGEDLWCIALQRRIEQGPFEPDETRQLATLWRSFSDAATLSRQLGFARVLGMVDGLDHVAQGAIAFNPRGEILAHNAAAEAEFGLLFEKRLGAPAFYDRRSQARFDALLAAATADPVVRFEAPAATVLDRSGRAVQLRAVTLHDWGRYAFTGARVLVLLKRVETAEAPPRPLWTYGLTPAEARLAAELVGGASLAEAAAKAGIAYQTARTQLKAVFAKTGAHRQAELVALLTGRKGAPAP